MALQQAKIKQLRAIGHKLKPVVTVSDKGISEGILTELERALNDHELIKVKLNFDDREAKKEAIAAITEVSKSECVQAIGKMILLYRLAKQTNKKLSNLHRVLVISNTR